MKQSNSIIVMGIVLCVILGLLVIWKENSGGDAAAKTHDLQEEKNDSIDDKDREEGNIDINTNDININETNSNDIKDSDSKEKAEKAAAENRDIAVEKLSYYQQYLSGLGSDKTLMEFVNHLEERYGEEVVKKLAEDDGTCDIKKAFYEMTGNSVFVELDEFLGNGDYRFTIDSEQSDARITFAGDVCLEEDGFVIDHYDTTAGLSECISPSILAYTNAADVFMLNNEFSFSDRGEPLRGKMYTFRAMPERVSILKELGTDVVSLANNHVYDYGPEAFSDTISCLDRAGIVHVGGGNNQAEAEKVAYLNVNGIKIGIISASRAEKIRYTPQAGQDTPGIFLMYEPERFLTLTRNASECCDYLVAFIHWGTEDSRYYEAYQHDLAKNIFDAGADIIIGAHPHVLQGMEYIDGKPVIYSLGDFWFNGETKYTTFVAIDIGVDRLNSVRVFPCLQSNYTTTLIEEESEKLAFMQYLRGLSASLSISDEGILIPSE